MERFTFTAEGYKQAKEWLESTGKWEYISTHGFSTDGWSIIETANIIWEKEILLEVAKAPIYLVDEVGQWDHNTEETKKAWDDIKAKLI